MGLTNFRLATRRRTRIVIVLLALVAVAALIDAVALWRAQRWNQAIASGRLPPEASGQPLEVQFARASAQAASAVIDGNSTDGPGGHATDAALNRYRSLQGDTPLGQAARYNSANLLIRQAVLVRGSSQPGQAIPLIELAKETYRELLRQDPGDWNARYNLERAQRLLPDPDDTEVLPASVPNQAERAATTMRGTSLGLP